MANRAVHLASRFATSLSPRSPSDGDLAWVRAALHDAEWEVWCRLQTADRVESIATARRLVEPYASDPRWRAAALLHDVGKADARLGTASRVVATLIALVRDPARLGGRFGRYLRHAEIGAATLRDAGARPEAAVWSAIHHHPERWSGCTIPLEVCEALARADGESR